jgi:hydroxypyruvate reductase
MRATAEDIFFSGLNGVEPENAIKRHIRRLGNDLVTPNGTYDLNTYRNIYIVGGGKAGAPMAKAMEDILGERISEGLVIVKYGHGEETRKVKVLEAAHPIPDESGVRHTKELLDLLKRTQGNDLVVCLLSGGGSALMIAPAEGVSLQEKQELTRHLLECGASINEINTLRKHVSAIKGGRLAKAACPSTVICLILSDVVGDDLSTIASGPTYPDGTTFSSCLEILERYGIKEKISKTIIEYLEMGCGNQEEETLKRGNPALEKTENIIVGSNIQALQSAKAKADTLGFNTLILSSSIEGETKDVAKVHAAIVKEIIATENPIKRPACILSGGETTVKIQGTGKGGRNQEFALVVATEIDGIKGVTILCAGTDGNDGPTDAAGAIVDGDSMSRSLKKGLKAREFLDNNDSYSFFSIQGDLFKTGPTKTNVMDLRIMLVS